MATTDEVWRLDNSDDQDCQFFQKMADHGHYGKREPNKSRQGTYVFTADGKFLASANDLSADRMLAMIQQGLENWEALPDDKKAPDDGADLTPENRWEDDYPHDGLVFTIYSRDLEFESSPESEPAATWNRDSAWFSRSEMESLIPLDLKEGESFSFPDVFIQRLAKLHLVDNVKGQTDDYRPEHIKEALLKATVESVESESIRIKIEGTTHAVVERGQYARSMKTKILGAAEWNPRTSRFTNFEFVAMAERTGRTRFNDRRKQLDSSPVGFLFELTPAETTPIVPGIIWAYDAPWIGQSN